jgi:hypothetical protein
MAEGLGTAPAQDPRKSRRGAPTGLRRLPWVISDISLVAPVGVECRTGQDRIIRRFGGAFS